jgi:hypothetical protein
MNNNPMRAWRFLRALAWALYALAVLGGAIYGYVFGVSVSGMPFGLLTAALAALFCSILADAGLRRMARSAP